MKIKIQLFVTLALLAVTGTAQAQVSGGIYGVQPSNDIVWDSGNSEFQVFQKAVRVCTNSLKATGNEVAFKMCMSDHGFGINGFVFGETMYRIQERPSNASTLGRQAAQAQPAPHPQHTRSTQK